MTTKTISVLFNEGYELVDKEVGSLADKQSLLNGNIDCKALPCGIDIWFNEEFLFSGLEVTTLVLNSKGTTDGLYINGPVYLAGGDSEGETVSLTEEQKLWVEENILYYPVPLSDRKLLIIHGYES